jgi:hypothetical protein
VFFLAAKKRERLDEILRRLRGAHPFADGGVARMTLEEVMRGVEDEMSGIPENPNSAIAPRDGRMYPPDDQFEIESGSPFVRTFKQTRHRTSFGVNGSVLIVTSDGTVECDLPGLDGKKLVDLLEQKHETN